MYTPTETIDLETTDITLPDLTGQLYNGQVVIVTRGGHELAVVMGIDEYRRLKEIEEEQREQDFAILMTLPEPNDLSDEEIRQLAVEETRAVRAEKYARRTNP